MTSMNSWRSNGRTHFYNPLQKTPATRVRGADRQARRRVHHRAGPRQAARDPVQDADHLVRQCARAAAVEQQGLLRRAQQVRQCEAHLADRHLLEHRRVHGEVARDKRGRTAGGRRARAAAADRPRLWHGSPAHGFWPATCRPPPMLWHGRPARERPAPCSRLLRPIASRHAPSWCSAFPRGALRQIATVAPCRPHAHKSPHALRGKPERARPAKRNPGAVRGTGANSLHLETRQLRRGLVYSMVIWLSVTGTSTPPPPPPVPGVPMASALPFAAVRYTTFQ